MRRHLLIIFSLLFAFSWQASAQKEELKFNVKGGSTQLKMLYRLANVGDKAEVTLGNGQTLTLEQKKEGKELETCVLELTPKAEDYDLTIEADKLVTLRIAASKCVNGVKSLQSKSLVRLNLDETKLTETPELDFSNCPNIEEITLGGADVTDVILSNNPKLKTFIASPALFSQKAIKTLDLSACSQLETLGLQGVAVRTIDVRACRETLKQLTIRGVSNKEYPTVLLGGKDLKKLTLVNISQCAIGMDDLPDLNEMQLDNFKIGKMYWHYVKAERVNALTVDFKNLKFQKGISEVPLETKFTWFQKVDGTWVKEPLDNTKVTEKEGLFTFDPSILDASGKATVRCKVENAGYPGLANNTNTGLLSYNITLTDPSLLLELTVTKESIGKDEDDEDLTDFDMTMQIGGAPNTNIQIDWGDGERKDYTITSSEAQQVSATVDLGSVVRIYGDVTLLDASQTHLVGIKLQSNAAKLKKLRLAQNKIESINLKRAPNLEELSVTDNKLTSLDLAFTPALSELYCGYNTISSLDLDKVPLLSVLNINNNGFTSLDTKVLPQLEILVASDNTLSSLDLSANKKLRSIDLMNNKLTELKLGTKELQRVLLNNNLLASIAFEGTEAPKLYALDLGKNNLDACSINDYLMLLPEALTAENAGPNNVVKLAGNPGSTTYDKALLPVAKGDGGLTWMSDVEGDGTGCATAKVFDLSNRENGAAKLFVSGSEVAFETPIAKNSPLVAVLTPKQGYKVASLRFNGKEESASSSNPNEFSLKLEHNSRLFYTFAEDTALDDVFASPISVARVAEGYQLGNLPTGATYSLYSVEGALLAQGTIAHGTLTLSLERGNYLLSINGSTLKLAF